MIEPVDYEVVEDKGIKTTRGGRLIVNEDKKLEKFPLEKIGFLREEFPEMFRYLSLRPSCIRKCGLEKTIFPEHWRM